MISVIHEEKKCVDFSILMKNKNHYKVAKIIINKMLLDLIKYDFFLFLWIILLLLFWKNFFVIFIKNFVVDFELNPIKKRKKETGLNKNEKHFDCKDMFN